MYPESDILYKNGSRGSRVAAIQDLLNFMKPSSLTPLKVDGIFGAKTEVRVKEFQRNHGYRATGMVDRETLALLSPSGQKIEEIGAAFRGVITEYRRPHGLTVYDREWGESHACLVPIGYAQVVIIGAAVVIFYAFCATMHAINTTPQHQQQSAKLGRVISEELDRIRTGMAENRPSDLAVRAYDGVRRIVREFTQEMGVRKRMCEEKTHPVEQTIACRAALAAFTTALVSLNEQLARLPGGTLSINLPPDVLLAAVLGGVRGLVLALNAIAQECLCPFIAF
jgi:hypothetical protein